MAKKRFFQESELKFVENPTIHNFKDLEGQTFGRLNVIGFAGTENKSTFWYCKCLCGNITKALAGNLKKGVTTSCGCFNKERTIERSTIHGHAKKGDITPTFLTWTGMLVRCQNPNTQNFKDYGGRGITVCKRWLKFENFLADMGEKPEGLTLDRKENDKGYFKENCRWATMEEQSNNRRSNHHLTFNRKTQTVSQWAKELGFKNDTLYDRLRIGWTVERTLTTTVRMKK